MDEFEYQLRAEQEEQEGKRKEECSTKTYVDPSDGTVYEWDNERNGWFPKIDNNFLAAYQAAYGFQTTPVSDSQPAPSNPTVATAAETASQLAEQAVKKSDKDSSEVRKRKPQSEAAEWFEMDDSKNTNVYVSGLPTDITMDEFKDLMQQKGGIIAVDDEGTPRIKLYTDEEGHMKGDGLCCYLKVESVQLVIQLLHESKYRDHTLSVEKAKFQLKGNYNPELKRKKKKAKKKKNVQEKLLDWRERPENAGPKRMNFEKVIILKHLFDPKEFEEDPTLINDIREDVTGECGKFGTVKKCVIYDRHPEGIVSVAFKEFEGADACQLALHGRWFGGQQLSASQWDGHTQYDVEETSEEREKRLKQWEKFISSKESEVTGRNTGTVFTFYKDIQNELDNHFTKALSQPPAADTVGVSHSSTSLISSSSSTSLLPPLSAPPILTSCHTSPLPPFHLMSPLTVGQIHSPTFTYPPMFSTGNFSPQGNQGNPKARMQILHPEMASLLIYPDIDTFHDLPKVPGQSEFPGPPPKVQFNEAVYSPSYLASSPGLTYQATTFFAANNYTKLTDIVPSRPSSSSQSKPMTTQLASWDWQDVSAAAPAAADQPLLLNSGVTENYMNYHNQAIMEPSHIW